MTGFFKDLFSGNFSGVVEDITSATDKLPAPVQAFITKVESDAEGLLGSLCATAIKDVETAGFTTASFVAAAKDVIAQALSQGSTILISDAMAMLNMFASTIVPSTTAAPVADVVVTPTVDE